MDPLDGQAGAVFGQFALQVGTTAQGSQSMDLVDVHVIAAAVSGPTSPSTLLTFETGDTGAAAMGSNDFGGAVSSISSTPPAGGSTGSAKSAQIALHTGDASWTGALIATLPAGQSFTSASHHVVTMNVYSPVAGADIHLKLQADSSNTSAYSTEMNASTKTVVGWQTMTFDFANVNTNVYAAWSSSRTYGAVYIFPDFTGNESTAVSKTANETFYFDDIAFNGATTPAVAGSTSSSGLPTSRIVTPSTGVNGLVDKTSAASGFAQYYGTGLGFKDAFVTKGSTFTLKFHVVDGSGVALTSQAVTLIANKGYSGSNATFTSGSTPIAATSGGTDSAAIAGTTDSSGDVSFTLTDTSASGEASTTSTSVVDPLDGQAGAVFGQFALQFGTTVQANQAMDIVDVHVIASTGGSSTPPTSSGLKTARFITTSSGVRGTVDKTSAASGFAQYYGAGLGWKDSYVTAGSTFILSWHVTDANGNAMANQSVTLLANKGYSGSTASFISGIHTIPAIGGGTNDGADIPGKTDANGNVNFLFTDASTSSEPSNTSVTALDPLDGQAGSIYGQFALQIDNTSQIVQTMDLIDLHIIASSVAPVTPPGTLPVLPGLGGGTAIIGGNPVNVQINSSDPNYIQASGAGWGIIAGGTDADGNLLPTNGGTLSLNPGSGTSTNGNGFLPNDYVSVYVYSTATLLGTFPVDSSGHFTGVVTLPSWLPTGTHTLQIVGHTAGNSLLTADLPVVVAPKAVVKAPTVIAKVIKPFRATSAAKTVVNLTDNTVSCMVPTSADTATFAAYYLFINHELIGAKRFGDFPVNPLYPEIDATAGSASASSASWGIAPSWNNGHISRANCVVQIGTSDQVVVSQSSVVTIKRVGKYTPITKLSFVVKPTDVTMRLVSPVLKKDKSGSPVDFVDFSSDPVQNGWAKYYGQANGGMGVFYKYFNAGSTMNITYHVTDSNTKKALSYFKVWLIVNKNYGGVQMATFTYQKNGISTKISGHATDLGETQIAGMTDANGDVTFTLVNTDSASVAEPKPSALNVEQPKNVKVTDFSTITLTAHVTPNGVETHETKDMIWAHIVQP